MGNTEIYQVFVTNILYLTLVCQIPVISVLYPVDLENTQIMSSIW
jgi:hypothetical protein